MTQPAQAMAGELYVKDRIAPVIVIAARCAAGHMPTRHRRAGFGLRAIAQKQKRDAAFSRCKSQAAAGHQIQAFGHAFRLQQHRAHRRAGQDVVGRAQRIGGVAGPDLDQAPGIAAQFEQALGRQRAIFHRLIIGPDPEKRLCLRAPKRQQRGKAAGAPPRCENFVQGPRLQAATQNRICLWMTCSDGRALRRQAITCQGMAQFRQFCAFVHVMFYNARRGSRVNWNPFL